MNKPKNNCRRGFTILEAAIATIIIGVAITAIMTLFATCTKVNDFGSKMSSGIFLAEQMRNMTDEVAFDDLPSLNGAVFNGADSDGNPVDGFRDFTQTLSVQPIDWQTMGNTSPGSDMLVITAQITRNNQKVSQLSWVRTQ